MAFEEVDAATIAIELDDFLRAVAGGRSPEVDGRDGLLAVAAVWAVAESHQCGSVVAIAEVADGTISAAQDEVDETIGLLGSRAGG